VQLAGDAKAAPGVGTAADAGLPPETSTSGGGSDPKLALALAAAGVALLGAPLLTKKSCDEATAAAVRSQIAAACSEISSTRSDIANANARHTQAMVAISQFHATEAAVGQAHAGIDAIRAARNWRWSSRRLAQVTLVHSINDLPKDMATADFEAALARAHADIDIKMLPADSLTALYGARDAATADLNTAAARLDTAQANLQDAQAQWNGACGPAPACGA
jgi:hypothetical protein